MKGKKLKIGKSSLGGALIGLIALVIIFGILSPSFFTTYNIINIARQSSINLILAVGMTFVILTGGIDLSVGGLEALVGTLAAGCMVNGMSPVLAVLIGLVIGLLFGGFNGVCIAYARIPAFITTMATVNIARSIALIYTGGYPISGLPKSFSYLGTGTVGFIPVPVIIAILVVVIGFVILKRTVLGRYIYAIGGNEESTAMSGIDVKKWKLSVYANPRCADCCCGTGTGSQNEFRTAECGGRYRAEYYCGSCDRRHQPLRRRGRTVRNNHGCASDYRAEQRTDASECKPLCAGIDPRLCYSRIGICR